MSEIGNFRKAKDQCFGGDQNSPLTLTQRERFSGLRYFEENSALQFVLSVEEFAKDDRDVIQMATSSGDSAPHLRWGQLKFEVDGTPVSLTVYRDVEAKSISFPSWMPRPGMSPTRTDVTWTCPTQATAAWWWTSTTPTTLTVPTIPTGAVPIPPSENGLPVAVTAGEKTFSDAEVH